MKKMDKIVELICDAVIAVTFILCCFLYCTREVRAAIRDQPREVLCTRSGFVIYNGMATGFKKLSPNRFTFIDLTYSRAQKTVYGQCYAFVEGVWEQPRKGESK